MTARPIRHKAQVPDRNGKIFYTRLCTKVVCQGCCAPLESLLTSPVGDVDSPHRKLSQKAHPAVCGEEKALLRKCNNPL